MFNDYEALEYGSRQASTRSLRGIQNQIESTSVVMQRVLAHAAKVAAVDSTVLITGETGVGKERLARWIHRVSRRTARPFVAVNCGALAESVIESELFGHVRGAFTGAVGDRAGMFEAADGGTLFLDEIGEVSPAVQVRLLRTLQEREVRRIGENRTRSIDVRLMAATNRNLPDDVQQGRFREDLYYRLGVVDLHIPALRQRPEDLRRLAHTLLSETAARLGRSITGYTPSALDSLLSHIWPGNIRELEHAIERACVVANGALIDLEDLPESVRHIRQAMPTSGREVRQEREQAFVKSVLERHSGNRVQAATELGVSLSTLKRRLRRLQPPSR